MAQWDGTERRVGEGDRRKAQMHIQEYPKMVNGQIVNRPAERPHVKPAPKLGRKK